MLHRLRGRLREHGEDDAWAPGCARTMRRELSRCVNGFPAGTADRAADPFRRARTVRNAVVICGGLGECDAIPEDKGGVLLHADAGVRADLGLEDARGCAGALGKMTRAFLEEIKRVEGWESPRISMGLRRD